jgi:hypothetical protein
MPGLVPGIHVFGCTCKNEDVDGRDEPAMTALFDELYRI